ncbi:MAG: hypothetical protein JEZ14_26430 [Marinilabiliaceae bacterium]|nr:hypothetical protein [Marinilabiliaceae bacterium]
MQNQSNTIAILSYVWFIGWIIAFIMRQNERPQRELSRFHLRQSFGILLIILAHSFVAWILHFMYLGFISNMLWFGIFILWLIGLMSAVQGQFKPIPFIGRWFEENFTFIR